MPDLQASDFRHGDSGHSRRRRDDREIPDAVIAEAIEDGSHVEQGDGTIKCRTDYLGYTITAIVNPDRGIICTTFGDDAWKEAGL